MKKQQGFSIVEGLLIALVLAVVGFGGWYVLSKQDKNDSNNSQQTTQQPADEANENETGSEDIPATEEEIEKAKETVYTAVEQGEPHDDDTGNHRLTVNKITRDVKDNDQPTDIYIAFDVTIENISDTKTFEYSYKDFTLVNADGGEMRATDGLGQSIVGPGQADWLEIDLAPGESKRVVVFFYTKDRGDSESGKVYWQPEGSTDKLTDAFTIRYSSNAKDLE